MNIEKLWNRNFTLVVIGQIISLFGNGIIRFALPLYLLKVTGSAALFGITAAFSFIPMIILTPVGGIIADRVNKRNVMVILDFLTAALITAFFILLGKVDLVILFTVTLMTLYGIQGAYQPTVQASMPLLATKENLLSANSIINQVNAASNLLAPLIGGSLFSTWGLNPVLILGIIAFFVSAVMELFIKMPHVKSREKQNILDIVKQDMKDSFNFIAKDNPIFIKTVSIFLGYNLFFSSLLLVAIPVLVTQTLGMPDIEYGITQAAMAAGALCGGILTGVFANKLMIHKVYLFLLLSSLLLLPVGLVFVLGLPPFVCYVVITVSCFCLMGLSSIVGIQMLTFMQAETPPELIGKVISLILALILCAQPLGQSMYGMLFDAFVNQRHFIVLLAGGISALIALQSKRVFKKYKNYKTNVSAAEV